MLLKKETDWFYASPLDLFSALSSKFHLSVSFWHWSSIGGS
jgi:hypothetical protein